MAPPPVSIYVTSLTSQPKVRQNTELLRRSLRGLEIPYTEHDLVMEEDAKLRWQRAKPAGQVVGLPGYLVGGEWVGTMDDFEYAAETANLPSFLRQDTDLAANQSMGDADLDSLMKDVDEAELSKFAAQMGKDETSGSKGVLAEKEGKGQVKTDTGSTTTLGSASKAGETSSSAPATTSSVASTLRSMDLGKDPVKGISTAAQATVNTITQTASSLLGSLGISEPTSSTTPTASKPITISSTTAEPSSTETAPKSLSSTSPTAIAPGSSSAGSSPVEGKSLGDRPRRMSKQEIAERMKTANSLEGLLETMDMAEGKN